MDQVFKRKDRKDMRRAEPSYPTNVSECQVQVGVSGRGFCMISIPLHRDTKAL